MPEGGVMPFCRPPMPPPMVPAEAPLWFTVVIAPLTVPEATSVPLTLTVQLLPLVISGQESRAKAKALEAVMV